jgi:hypothetical protein
MPAQYQRKEGISKRENRPQDWPQQESGKKSTRAVLQNLAWGVQIGWHTGTSLCEPDKDAKPQTEESSTMIESHPIQNRQIDFSIFVKVTFMRIYMV